MFESFLKGNILKFYCVSCNKERHQRIPAKVGSPEFFAHILITTAFLTVIAYPWLHLRGFLAFVIPVGLMFEVVTRMKTRAARRCPECYFDPTLYYVNRAQALKLVQDRWKEKFEKAGFEYPDPMLKKFTSRAARSIARTPDSNKSVPREDSLT